MGFEDWIPIFQGGKVTDSAGRLHDGDALIEKAVATFQAAEHEPPVVIGHPQDNAPAWGWVEGLKREGNRLLAKFKQVQPEFADMVRKGLFKKRSAAFYPDGRLRHVGFLGAMPPAVKGLPDIGAFDEGESVTFEFADQEDTMGIEEKMTEFLDKLGSLLKRDPGPGTGAPATFSEADIETAKKQAATEAAQAERDKVTAEFAEQRKKDRIATRRGEVTAWCEGMVKTGKMTPAMVKYGVPEFLMAFAESDDVLEFGEEKAKATLYDRFKTFFEAEMPKVVTFKEIATRKTAAASQGNPGEKLDSLVAAKLKDSKDLTYSAAFAEVQRENPDLAAEYAAEFTEVK